MVRDPAVFLFDEPLSNLDAQLRTQMRLEIKKLHQRVGSTIIFVTHDQVEAMTMADRIVIMKDGYIQQIGTPQDVFHQPANLFVAQFIGAPAMNMLNGTCLNNRIVLDGDTKVDLPGIQLEDNKAVVLGVRSDDLTVGGEPPLFSGDVSMLEPLGSETLVYVTVNSVEVIAKASGRTPPEIGERVVLGAPRENMHLFDASSGLRLS
jgi:multiple sugar transport system ATP-binding protein